MITIRKSGERGPTKIDWLDSKHTFSFGGYMDRDHMGFGTLRVINEDWVKPGAGFSPHPHHDMEIITYVLEGALEHKDSLGNGSIIVPGDVQRMSAGTGIVHSEFNPQPDKPVHLLQIWILPAKRGIKPSYEQKNFTQARKPGKLTLIASQDGREGSVSMNQDAALSVLDMAPGQEYVFNPAAGKLTWIQVARGKATLNGQALNQGDGAAVEKETALNFSAQDTSEILIFNLAA